MIPILWALISAVLYGTGSAFQQHQAAAAPDDAAGRPKLLLLLVQKPWWLLGIAAEMGGFASHAIALRSGPLTVVQMLLASSLVFSVATVRMWSGRPLGWTTWAAALAVVAGIGSFVALASPGLPDGSGLPRQSGLAAVCLAATALPFALAGLASAGRRRAALLAVGAGLADACVAVVTMTFAHVAGQGLGAIAGSWSTYALVLGGPCSLLLTQTAYQVGRPMITLPIATVVTPMASLVAGVVLLGETTRLGVGSGLVAVLAVLVTAGGLVTLARRASGQTGSEPVPAPARPGSGPVPGEVLVPGGAALMAGAAMSAGGPVSAGAGSAGFRSAGFGSAGLGSAGLGSGGLGSAGFGHQGRFPHETVGARVRPLAKQVLAATFTPAVGNMPFWMLP